MMTNKPRVPCQRLVAALIVFSVSIGCGNTPPTTNLSTSITLPAQSEWVDYGTIFPAGTPGEWDYYLWGGFAFSIIKMDDTYFLYYQGSSDYRTEYDETVLWRAIGVATSQDGINFSKHPGNPVITWFPNQNGEEGAVSSGVTLGDTAEVVLYYGANTEEDATRVNSDIRIASSTDGLNFNDLGMVLSHKDPSVWGSGDELFPVDAIYDQGQWLVYYIPNGTQQSGKLGVAYGFQYDTLDTSSVVKKGKNTISVWGTAGHVKIDQMTLALILNNVRDNQIEVRFTSLLKPNAVSDPVVTYQFEGVQQANFLLDEERKTWFLYYRATDRYGVMLAPAGEIDATPPSAPQSLTAIVSNDQQVDLSWQAAEDSDTGILQYRVYRDNALIDSTSATHFTDKGLIGNPEYRYQVSAVNYHGVEGLLSSPVTVGITEPGTYLPWVIMTISRAGNSSAKHQLSYRVRVIGATR